jgi:hypothetical protein
MPRGAASPDSRGRLFPQHQLSPPALMQDFLKRLA